MASHTVYPIPETPLIIKQALISVSDKSGLEPLAKALHAAHVRILSTGGTSAAIAAMGIPVTDVSEITQFQECLDGRVKTLHPAVHAGILARTSVPTDVEALSDLGYGAIELVVVNLYPFEATVARQGVTLAEAAENIDIGGPTMVRAAAKNFGHVAILTDPAQYPDFIEAVGQGAIPYQNRLNWAVEAFNQIARYDAAIAEYLMNQQNADKPRAATHISLPLHQALRYGENPHQPAAVYGNQADFIDCFHGKELSYNNFLDVDAALAIIGEFDNDKPVCAIIKHTVACGVGRADTLTEAYNRAFATDTVSPFGGIVAVNRQLDLETAHHIDAIFTEIIIAPGYDDDALALLTKKANRRLIRQRQRPADTGYAYRSVFGGLLAQKPDLTAEDPTQWAVVTSRKPSAEEFADMEFAWKVVKHTKSNAIVFCKDGQTLGIGTGQTSRVDSAEIAVWKASKAELSLQNSVVASDAFFPFADGVEAAAQAGATAVIQPGGSVRDQEVIDTANRLGLTMVFTGIRHFRH